MKNGVKILLAIMVLTGFGVFNNASAIGEDFFVTFAPQYPPPGTEITARVKSYGFDVDRSKIIWKVDGEVVAAGLGERSIKVIAPEVGKNRKINVSIITNEDLQTAKDFIIGGNDVDFLWEALTVTPVWYHGKALPVIGSRIKITAIPYLFSNGVAIPSSQLVYEWSVNYHKDISGSGTGKDNFSFRIEDYDEYMISLHIASQDNKASFEKNVSFSGDKDKPMVIFYEDSPLEGIQYNNALKNEYELTKTDFNIKAEPYFFSKENIGRFSYRWKMNNGDVQPDQSPSILGLRADLSQSGSSLISLRIENSYNLFQVAENILKINFGQ